MYIKVLRKETESGVYDMARLKHLSLGYNIGVDDDVERWSFRVPFKNDLKYIFVMEHLESWAKVTIDDVILVPPPSGGVE